MENRKVNLNKTRVNLAKGTSDSSTGETYLSLNNKKTTERKLLKEIVFWIVLLGIDVLFIRWLHGSVKDYGASSYIEVMPIMLPLAVIIPVLAAALRYIPKSNKRLRKIFIPVAIVLGIALGELFAFGFYGNPPFFADLIYGKTMKSVSAANLQRIDVSVHSQGEESDRMLSFDHWNTVYFDHWSSDKSSLIIGREFQNTHGEMPESDEYLILHFVYLDGTERTIRVFDQDGWEYIEEPNIGIWRKKLNDHTASCFSAWKEEWEKKNESGMDSL